MRLAWICLTAVAVLATACTPDPGPSVTPSPSPTRASASPTPTDSETPPPSPTPDPSPSPTVFESFPPPPPGETEEQAAIRAGWEAYNHVVDKFLRDPSLTDLTETQHVTTGDESNRIIDEIQLTRQANVRVEGDGLFRDVRFEGPTTNDAGIRVAHVTYCFDPKYQRVIDLETNEPHPDARTTTLRSTDRLEQLADGSWRVALHENEAVEC